MPIKVLVGTPEAEAEQKASINVVVGGRKEPQATIRLEVSKNMNGDLIVKEHPMIDIYILPEKNKIVTFPKSGFGDQAYTAQRSTLMELVEGGVLDRNSIQGGMVYGALEAKILTSEEVSPVQVLLYELDRIVKNSKNDFQTAHDYEEDVEDRFLNPSDEESTDYGEIPPEEERRKKEMDKPYYSYSGFGYLY
jgi:hypothetical protein